MKAGNARLVTAVKFIISVCLLGWCLSACSDSPTKPKQVSTYFGPTITVQDPARAAMLQQGSRVPSLVAVSGVVCDSFQAITNFNFNDDPMVLTGTQPEEPFTSQVSSPWGLTIMHGTILNDLGWQGHLAHSFLRSPEFFPPATQDDPAARAPRAVVTQLGQEVIDDRDPEDLDDLASIAAYAVTNYVDFNWFVENPVVDTTWNSIDYKVYVNDVDVDRVEVTMWLRDGGIWTQVSLHDVTISAEVCAVTFLGDVCAPLTLRYSLIDLSMDVMFELVGDSLQFETEHVDVSVIASMAPSDCGLPEYLCLPWDAISVLTAKELESTISGNLESILSGLQGGFLTRFSTAERPIDPPAPFDQPYEIQSSMDYLEITPEHARLGSYAQVWPASPLETHDNPLGAIAYGGPAPSLDPAEDLAGVGLKGDLLNQALWSIWQNGAFDIDSDELIAAELVEAEKLEGVEFSIFSELPPVLMQSLDTEVISIGWGDMYVDVTLPDTLQTTDDPFVRAYVSARVGGQIEFDDLTNTVGVELDSSTTEIYVQVTAIHEPLIRSWVNNYFHTKFRSIVPKVLGSALDVINMPKADLEQMMLDALEMDEFPEGESFFPGQELRLTNAGFHLEEGYHCLTGGIEIVDVEEEN